MGASPIKLLVVDDHKVLRMGLQSLFDTVKGVEIVGEAATAAEAVQLAERCKPDVVLLDIRLPDASGTRACRAIRAARPETRVIMLTGFSDDNLVIASILAGASGFLLKETDAERLIDAVHIVAGGSSFLDPKVTHSVLERFQSLGGEILTDSLTSLTEQERSVLRLIAEGKTNRQISEDLSLSVNTVKTYVSTIFQKLHVSRRAEAAAIIAAKQR